jgi:hypothetical protein
MRCFLFSILRWSWSNLLGIHISVVMRITILFQIIFPCILLERLERLFMTSNKFFESQL